MYLGSRERLVKYFTTKIQTFPLRKMTHPNITSSFKISLSITEFLNLYFSHYRESYPTPRKKVFLKIYAIFEQQPDFHPKYILQTITATPLYITFLMYPRIINGLLQATNNC